MKRRLKTLFGLLKALAREVLQQNARKIANYGRPDLARRQRAIRTAASGSLVKCTTTFLHYVPEYAENPAESLWHLRA